MLTVNVISDVDRPVRPSFLALSSLSVVNPLPFVAGPVEMSIDAVPMRFVIYPFSVVNISVTIFEVYQKLLGNRIENFNEVETYKFLPKWLNFYHEILKSFNYKGLGILWWC